MEEWKECRLGDLCIDNKGSYGIAASAAPYSEDLYTYLRITDINDDGTLNKSDLKSVADENAEQYLLQPNDIVFARTGGSTGRNYFYDGTDGVFVYAGFLIKFSIDPNKVNPKYIKYYCLSQEYKNWVYSFNTGSTRGNINAQTYSNMPIILPPRSQQDLLVKTLSSLDDKIELNNKINTNLEQQAQALFKNWFVDFEPFGGKMPDGWKVGKLCDIADYSSEKIEINKLTLETYYSTENMLPSKGGIETATSLPSISHTTRCLPGETIISNIRPYFKKIFYCTEEVAGCSTDVLCFKPKNKDYSEYLYQVLYSDIFFDYMVLGSKGTKMPRGDKQQIMNYTITIPDELYLHKYKTLAKPILSQIDTNRKENKRLSEIRDTLLPKLMNGEFEV